MLVVASSAMGPVVDVAAVPAAHTAALAAHKHAAQAAVCLVATLGVCLVVEAKCGARLMPQQCSFAVVVVYCANLICFPNLGTLGEAVWLELLFVMQLNIPLWQVSCDPGSGLFVQ